MKIKDCPRCSMLYDPDMGHDCEPYEPYELNKSFQNEKDDAKVVVVAVF